MLGIHPEDAGEFARIWVEARANAGSICHEHRRLLPDGSTVWARVLLTPLLAPNGTVQSHVGTLEDITELRQSRHDLLKNQKLESLGVLAGGIAHDFNNILTAIFGNISLARFQLHDAALAAKRLEDAENAIVRAADLTKQLLTFARGGEPVKQVIHLNRLLREAAGFMLQGSLVRSEFQLAADIPPVEADYGQLSQVIHNLVLNAVQAMPGGGTVTIGSDKVSSREQGGCFARIWVADPGTGISEEIMQKIFDPYFTTKANGNGLGLATCHSIVRKHGGKIRAESSLGKGSRFIISLPAAERAYVADPDAPAALYPGSGLVLLMDDNDAIRITAQGILEELGYRVEVAVDGVQALECYRRAIEQGTPFSAAILDLTIPGGMGGRETIEELLKIDPAVKAIVSSGYSEDPVLANHLKYGFRAVLNKPYRLQEMSLVLKRLLES
jgi:two-component system cell cycle sensor histidine kinase/response regulator CckA